MKTILCTALLSLVAAPVFAAPPYPLDELLVRAKFVCIAEATAFSGTNVSLNVQSELRGDLTTSNLTFRVDTFLGKPEKGTRYFVFSQGHDRWGEPKNQIKLSQGMRGQGSYCGWIMLPIKTVKETEQVHNAYTFKFRKAGEGRRPLILEEAIELVKQTKFKGEKNSEQPPERDK
jgi:hypothetical protein